MLTAQPPEHDFVKTLNGTAATSDFRILRFLDFQGFIGVLTKHGKISLLEKILSEYKRIIDLKEGLTEIVVTTSEPLQKEEENKLKKKLSDSLKLKIKLTKIIDKEIIGGIKIKIKSIMIDNSIKSKLTEFGI